MNHDLPRVDEAFLDLLVRQQSGPEPVFDAVHRDFLIGQHDDLAARVTGGGLLEFASLGETVPWLYRLTFQTRGLVKRPDQEVEECDRHVVALRFRPDYLRRADRFEMLALVEPRDAWHPNIASGAAPRGGGAICLELYPGESLVEIVESLHDVLRWKLRQYDERDALNPFACAWGRQNVDEAIDDRPLFGRRLDLVVEPAAPDPAAPEPAEGTESNPESEDDA